MKKLNKLEYEELVNLNSPDLVEWLKEQDKNVGSIETEVVHALPGLSILDVNIHEVSGKHVFDKISQKMGVAMVVETKPEWLEVFVKLEGADDFVNAKSLNCVIL